MIRGARVFDERAYQWRTADLLRFGRGLGLVDQDGLRATNDEVIDLGCGWGVLGTMLALHARRPRVVGWDLDEDLLALGRQVVRQIGLQRRVQLRVGDVQDLDSWGADRATVVVCQALLVHMPRATRFLAELVAVLPPGARVGVVETDAVAAARAIRDSVTDPDPEYGGLREQVARAVAAGGERALGVDQRLGRDLDRVLAEAGLEQVAGLALGAATTLTAPAAPEPSLARWFAMRLERRLAQGDDPVERSLAEAGGLESSHYDRWLALRDAANWERLQALRCGQYSRDDGWTARAAWGIKAG